MGEVMELRTSALEAHLGTPCDGDGVSVEVLPDFELHQVAAWPETVGEVRDNLLASAGISGALKPAQFAMAAGKIVFWIEPLKFWVLNHAPEPLPPEKGATLDQSHAFVRLRFSGSKATNHLNKFLPLDLREESFPDRATAMSDIHHVAVRLWRQGEEYHLLVPRGFAQSLFDLITPNH